MAKPGNRQRSGTMTNSHSSTEVANLMRCNTDGPSSNGRTADFGSVNLGSNPRGPILSPQSFAPADIKTMTTTREWASCSGMPLPCLSRAEEPILWAWPRRSTGQPKWSVSFPTTARADRFTKRRRYQEARVPLYWVVDGADHRVEVWTPDAEFPAVERERLVWRPAGAGQPFTLELADLFRPV